MTYGKAILGDNQFLGVNHSSQAKAAELFDRFKNTDAIIEVMGAAYDAGIRDFMFTTHDRLVPVLEEIRSSNLFPGLYYTPCLPYAHKYWNKLTEKGLVGLFLSTISQVNKFNIMTASLGLICGKTNGITQLLTEIEILMCKGLLVRGVFLQNLAFDFLMAMELHSVISSFAETVSHRFGVIPGFITMNHNRAVDTLCDKVGLEAPWICANYNSAGFRMNPSSHDCIASFSSGKSNNIAMSIFASGLAIPEHAMEFVLKNLKVGNINSVTFGSSSKSNIENNVRRILGHI